MECKLPPTHGTGTQWRPTLVGSIPPKQTKQIGPYHIGLGNTDQDTIGNFIILPQRSDNVRFVHCQPGCPVQIPIL